MEDVPTEELREILRATQALTGPGSSSVEVLCRELSRREQVQALRVRLDSAVLTEAYEEAAEIDASLRQLGVDVRFEGPALGRDAPVDEAIEQSPEAAHPDERRRPP